VVGIGLILLGVLAGLGMYASAAGPVGDFLEAMARGLLGLAGFAVPVLLAWFGLLVVMGRPSPEIGRIAIGAALLGVGLLGGWHLWQGLPVPGDGMRACGPPEDCSAGPSPRRCARRCPPTAPPRCSSPWCASGC
jgi:DNA segregation ATPase FtsK/SpoIIIE, S-DNA-T family